MLQRIACKIESQAHYPQVAQQRDEPHPELRSVTVSGYGILYFPLPDGIRIPACSTIRGTSKACSRPNRMMKTRRYDRRAGVS